MVSIDTSWGAEVAYELHGSGKVHHGSYTEIT